VDISEVELQSRFAAVSPSLLKNRGFAPSQAPLSDECRSFLFYGLNMVSQTEKPLGTSDIGNPEIPARNTQVDVRHAEASINGYKMRQT
jgi:hypothetical protein